MALMQDTSGRMCGINAMCPVRRALFTMPRARAACRAARRIQYEPAIIPSAPSKLLAANLRERSRHFERPRQGNSFVISNRRQAQLSNPCGRAGTTQQRAGTGDNQVEMLGAALVCFAIASD